jgi:glutamate carboxypeptidase
MAGEALDHRLIEPARSLARFLRAQRDAMVEAALELVRHESPSGDEAALDALADRLVARFEAAGAVAERVANPIGDHVRARWEGVAPSAAPALVLGHFDTVWPLGSLVRHPARIEEGCAFGPGIYDMKASLVLVEYALRAIRHLALPLRRPVVLLATTDEEIGSATSRALIEDEARRAAYVLVVEPPLPDGRLKTARKGVGHFLVQVAGRAAHAGVEPEKGVNAVVELAHQILNIRALGDPERGTTVTVALVQGGTASNTVPPSASAEIDVRVTSAEEAARIDVAMHALRPVNPHATLTITGGLNRPPMERRATAALFGQARRIGRALGLDLGEGSTGGGSDGNFTAALGVPTLDGLGALGDGAHAAHEHIRIDSLPERAALLALLLLGLEPPH